MADHVTAEVRSRIMASVGSRDTGPEMRVRRALHAAGLRFRTHAKDLPGKPDVLLPGRGIAVFIHGCFWHGCPRHYREPGSNASFWRAKIARNRQRDARVARELRRQGWSVLVVWQHDVAGGVNRILRRAAKSQTLKPGHHIAVGYQR